MVAMHPLLEHALGREERYLETLKELVLIESPTHDKTAADRLADHLATLLSNEGWTVERHLQQVVGDHLSARRDAPGDISTLLLAHYDTVWPVGTLEGMPFYREGDCVHGPGTSDMKAGITTCLEAIRIADERGMALRGPVTLLLTSDEESGSLHSRELIEELAKLHDRVLVVEPGSEDGSLKVGRKGTGMIEFRARGQSAHAGNNPEAGASALRELAHFLFFVEGLNDPEAGTSVNLTVASGGTVPNVIAEEASAGVDLRVFTLAEAERLDRELRNYRPQDPRVEVEITGGLNRPPMERTEANEVLLAEAEAVQRSMGFALGTAVVGGGSDGNFTTALGVATLDGLGSLGVGMHARHEHIELGATLERVALVTALVTRAG